jgi:hypothetical protein
MKAAMRRNHLASLLMMGLLVCVPPVQLFGASLPVYAAKNGCCASEACFTQTAPLSVAEDIHKLNHSADAQSQQENTGCDVCPARAGSSGTSLLLPYVCMQTSVMMPTAHFEPHIDTPVTPLHDEGLFRPPRRSAARTG